jgi:signal transduction histidine kinase
MREYRRTTIAMLGARAAILFFVGLLWCASWNFQLVNPQTIPFGACIGIFFGGVLLFLIRVIFRRNLSYSLFALLIGDLTAITALLVLTGGLRSPLLVLFFGPILVNFYYGNTFFVKFAAAGTAVSLVIVALLRRFYAPASFFGPGWTFTAADSYRAVITLIYVGLALVANWAALRRRQAAENRIGLLEHRLVGADEELARGFHDLEAAMERTRADAQQIQLSRQQLLRAERFSAAGKLAAGALHDLANPLSVIVSDVEMFVLKNEDRPEKAREVMRRVLTSAQHISMLLDNLRLLTKQRGDLVYTPVDVNHLIMRCLSALEPVRRRRGVVVDAHLEENAPKALGIESQLEQMVFNLLANAFEAITRPGGRVAVRTHTTPNCLVVEVEDDGEGIAKQHLRRIFEPFFTTRGSPSSLGLGLYSVFAIVEEHGGGISVRSEPGVATVFTVEVPLQPTRRTAGE